MDSLIDDVYAIDRHYTHKKIDPVVEKTRILKQLIMKYGLANGELIAIGDRASDINAGIAAGAVTYQYMRKGFLIDKTAADYKIYEFTEILGEI